jgi:hypothetical protein
MLNILIYNCSRAAITVVFVFGVWTLINTNGDLDE